MNERPYTSHRGFLALIGLSLLVLCLLFMALSLVQQPAYSQGLEATPLPQSPGAAEGVTTAVPTPQRTPCPTSPTPNPPGDKVKIVGDDEIMLTFRQASDSKYIANQTINNPVGGTALQASAVEFQGNGTANLSGVAWLVTTAGDMDADNHAELLSAYRNPSNQLSGLTDSYKVASEPDWLNSASPFSGSTVSWVDVAAGNLDRKTVQYDGDEMVIAFKDNNSDIHVALLDNSADYMVALPGTIATADNAVMAQWTKSDLERGDVNHVSVATGDLDADGYNDEIVVAYKDSGSDLQVQFLEYDGTTTLKELWRIDSRDNGRDNTASAASGMWANKWPIDVTTGDLDGDMMDEVVVAFRIGDSKSGDVQLWALDVDLSKIGSIPWTVDSSVWKNHPISRPSNTTGKAATAISVSANDLDGDGYDEIALGYNIGYEDTCNSSGYSYVCNARWLQQLVTYEYTPFAAPEYTSCAAGSSPHGCFRQRSGSWTSTTNYGRDTSAEGMVVVATGDLERDAKAEVALVHYQWENDNIETLAFDADGSLSKRATVVTDLGSNKPTDFWIIMGDRDKDSRWATYANVCYLKTEVQVMSAIFAPAYYPEEHAAGNASHTGASFGIESLQGEGDSVEVSTSIGSEFKVHPTVHEIGPSFTYGFEKEAAAEKTQMTTTVQGIDYETCPSFYCGEEEASYNGVQFIETNFRCFVYHEAEAGDMDVCFPAHSVELRYEQDWWYTEGFETYEESWVPLGHNLALGRHAEQSNDDPGLPAAAGRAVDGDVGTASHTNYPAAPATSWWQVDLGGEQWIGAVQVWNSTENPTRLADAYVFISNEEFTSNDVNTLLADPDVWNHAITGQAERPSILPANHHGRYVRIQAKSGNTGYLDVAEVQIYGMPGIVDQWPKAAPTSSGTDKLNLSWRDPNAPSREIVQTAPGQLLGVEKSPYSGVRGETLSFTSSVGFGKEGETIQSGSTSSTFKLGMEIMWFEGEVSTTTSQKTSHILSWENSVGFYGEVTGLPSGTDSQYWYEVGQYAWLQRATSTGGVNHAFLIGGYFVPQIGPWAPSQAVDSVSPALAAVPQPPTIKSNSHPDPGKWVADDTAELKWNQPAGDPAVVTGYTWKLDKTPDTIPYEANYGKITTRTFEGLADGVWYIHVRAVNNAGQWSDAAHRAIRVDTNAAEVTLTTDPLQPTGDNGWYITPVNVAASAEDGNGSGIAKLEVRTAGGAWKVYAAPLPFTTDTAGTTVEARATDATGNVSPIASVVIKLDRTAPDSHIKGGEGDGVWIARVITNLAGNEELVLGGAVADELSGISGMSLEYDGLDWTGASWLGSRHPLPEQPEIEFNWVFTATHEIGAGYHIFMGRAQDAAGNQETPYEIARLLWFPKDSPDIDGSSASASPKVIKPGGVVNFTVVARNAGPQEAHVAVVDTLPAGLTAVTDTLPEDAVYDPAARTLTWPARLLWPGDSVHYGFQARAAADLPAQTLENQATLHAYWPNTDQLSPADQAKFTEHEQTVTVRAAVAINPALGDTADVTPPWAALALGAQSAIVSPVIELGIPAAEDARWMYLREWTLDPATGTWKVAQNSGWMDYARKTTWTLSEGQGVKYLGVWVADAARNVSALNEQAMLFVNRMDTNQVLKSGQRIQYRGLLHETLMLLASLRTISGDPDMYIWRPRNAFKPDRYTSATVPAGEKEELGYEFVRQSGLYILEVEAIGDSEYQLLLYQGMAEPESARSTDSKLRPDHPLTASDPLSAEQIGPLVSLNPVFYVPVLMNSK